MNTRVKTFARKRLAQHIGAVLRSGLPWSALAALPGIALAGPTGGVVVGGSATIHTPDAVTTRIDQQSARAAINWQRFSIAGNEYVQFNQPDATSVALNRVVGIDPSVILGNLSANGRVFLVNPRGVYFGPGARVDVAGLAASIFDIRTEDFMAGRYVFTRPADAPAGASVINDGVITARDKGFVVLAGDYTANHGIIQARLGTVALASGNGMTLDLDGDGLLSFVVDGKAVTDLAGVENSGEVYADGGRVIMTAKVGNDLIGTAVNQQGLVRARGIVESGGEIYLTADGGDIVQGGTLDADTTAPARTGKITLTGSRDITLEPGSVITASGAPGGVHDAGEVRIVAENDLRTETGSSVQVAGGIDGGDGGFLELSGHHGLQLDGARDGRARHPGYSSGKLLLDPADVDITTITTTNCGVTVTCINPTTAWLTFGSVTVATGSGGQLRVRSPIADGNLDPGAKLVLQADTDIFVNAPIGTAGTRFAHDLELQAGNNVDVKDSIYLANNTLTITADTDLAGVKDGSGDVNVTAFGIPVTVDTLGGIAVSGQNFVIDGGSGSLGSASVRAGTDIGFNVVGDMTVRGGSANGFGSARSGSSGATGDANATVEAGGNINITADRLMVLGGRANAFATKSGDAVATAVARIHAGQNINLNIDNGLMVMGGRADATAESGSLLARATANADAIIQADGTLTANVTAGGVTVRGGNGASAELSSSGSRVANALARGVIEGANVAITIDAGGLTVSGGSNPRASIDYDRSTGAVGNALADASARIKATGGGLALAVNGGNLLVRGGNFAYASASEASGHETATAMANAELSALTDLSITVANGNVAFSGGTKARADGSGSDSANRNVDKSIANALVSAGNDLSITVSNGALTVAGGARGFASAEDGSGGSDNRVEQTATVKAARNLNVVTGGLFEVRGGQSARAFASDGTDAGNTASVDASAKVEATTGTLTVNAGGGLNVLGGNTAEASATDDGDAQAHAFANATLLGHAVNLTVGGTGLQVKGGKQADADATGFGMDTPIFAEAWSRAQISADTSLTVTVNAGGLTVAGGNQASAEASNADRINDAQAVANANAELLAGTDISLNVLSGALAVRGGGSTGSRVSADASAESATTNGARRYLAKADADGLVAAGRNLTVNLNGGDLLVQGGYADADVDDFAGGGIFAQATANANAALTAVANLTVNGARNVALRGGNANADFSDTAAGGELHAFANANARLVAGGSVSVSATNGITFSGGQAFAGLQTSSGGGGVDATTATAKAEIVSVGGTTLNTTAGPINFNPGIASTAGSGTSTANADVGINAGVLTILSGGDVLDATSISSSSSTQMPPRIRGTSRTRITAGALAIRAAGDLFLPSAAITVHSGGLPGEGDAFLTTNIVGLGIAPPPNPDPNALFAAGDKVVLNELTLTGAFPYIVLQGRDVAITAPVALPNASDILVQWKPPDPGDTVGLSALAGTPGLCGGAACVVNFFNDTGFGQLPGTTHAIGSSDQTAPIQVTGPIDIGSHNMVFVGPDIRGLELITTTGIVGIVEAVTVFNVPTVGDDVQGGEDDDKKKKKKEGLVETEDGGQQTGTINQEESNASGMCAG